MAKTDPPPAPSVEDDEMDRRYGRSDQNTDYYGNPGYPEVHPPMTETPRSRADRAILEELKNRPPGTQPFWQQSLLDAPMPEGPRPTPLKPDDAPPMQPRLAPIIGSRSDVRPGSADRGILEAPTQPGRETDPELSQPSGTQMQLFRAPPSDQPEVTEAQYIVPTRATPSPTPKPTPQNLELSASQADYPPDPDVFTRDMELYGPEGYGESFGARPALPPRPSPSRQPQARPTPLLPPHQPPPAPHGFTTPQHDAVAAQVNEQPHIAPPENQQLAAQLSQLEQMPADEMRDYLISHDDVPSAAGAPILFNKIQQEESERAQYRKEHQYWGTDYDLMTGQIGQDITALAIGGWHGIAGIWPGIQALGGTVGSAIRTATEAAGTLNTDAMRQYLNKRVEAAQQQLANHQTTQENLANIQRQVAESNAKLDQIDEIRNRRALLGTGGGLGGTAQTAAELQQEQEHIAKLAHEAAPEYVQNRAQQATTEFLIAAHVLPEELTAALHNVFGPTGVGNYVQTKYFGRPSKLLQFKNPLDLKADIDAERNFRIPLKQHLAGKPVDTPFTGHWWDPSNIDALLDAMPFGKRPGETAIEARTRQINQARGREQTSPEQLQARGFAPEPQHIRDTADTLELMAQSAIPVEQILGPLISRVLMGASRTAKLGARSAGALKRIPHVRPLEWWHHGHEILTNIFAHNWAGVGANVMQLLGERLGPAAIERMLNATADDFLRAAHKSYAGGGLLDQIRARLWRTGFEGAAMGAGIGAFTTRDLKEYGESISNWAVSHAVMHGWPILREADKGRIGDALFGTDHARPNTPVKDLRYGHDTELDEHSLNQAKHLDDDKKPGTTPGIYLPGERSVYNWLHKLFGMNNEDRLGRYTRVKQLMSKYAEFYLVDEPMMAKWAAKWGHLPGLEVFDPTGFTIRPEFTGTGKFAVFIDPKHFDQVFPHESAHVYHDILPPDLQKQVQDLVMAKNDIRDFTDVYSQGTAKYDDLPTVAEVKADPSRAHPSGLTKDQMKREMAAEVFGAFFNGGQIDDWTRDPTERRKMQMAMGKAMEQIGLPTTTWESLTKGFHLEPSVALAFLFDEHLRTIMQGKAVFDPKTDWSAVWGNRPQPPAPTRPTPLLPETKGPETPPPPSEPKGPTPETTHVPDESVIKGLMKKGFTRQQAEDAERKATVTKPGEKTPPAAEVKDEPPPQVLAPPRTTGTVGFSTSKGSTYVVHEDGTTTRTKAPRPEHPGDSGTKEQSAVTYYVSPEAAMDLSPPTGEWRYIDHGDGTISMAWPNPKTGVWGIAKSYRNIPVSTTPAVGLHPIELWNKQNVMGYTTYRKVHVGNDITELKTVEPPKKETEQPAAIEDEEGRHRKLKELLDQGMEPGEAQAIVEGRKPKTLKEERDEGTGEPKIQKMPSGTGLPPTPPSETTVRIPLKQPEHKEDQGMPAPRADFMGMSSRAPTPGATPAPPAPAPTPVPGQLPAGPPSQIPRYQAQPLGPAPSPTPSATPSGTPGSQPLPAGPPSQIPRYNAQPSPTPAATPAPATPAPTPAPPAKGGKPVKRAEQITAAPRGPAVRGMPSETHGNVTGSEFGEIDRPSRGGYTEPGWNRGAWGKNLEGQDNRGVALPAKTLSHFGNWHAAHFDDRFNSKYGVRITNPRNGQQVVEDLKDAGPGDKSGVDVDMLWGTRRALGLDPDFKGPLNVEIIDKATGKVVYTPQGGGGGEVPGGLPPGGVPTAIPYVQGPIAARPIPGTAPIAPAAPSQPLPVQGEPSGAAVSEGGGGGGVGGSYYNSPTSPYYGLASYRGAGETEAPAAPGGRAFSYEPVEGAAPISLMPRMMGGRGVKRKPAKGEEDTEGEPQVAGFEPMYPLLQLGTPKSLKEALVHHAKALSQNDLRVKKQIGGDNKFKGEYFVQGDPLHMNVLGGVPQKQRQILAAAQTAIVKGAPMHMTYASAPPKPGEVETPINRRYREVNYAESSPEARLLGQTNARLSAHSMLPVNVGVSLAEKAGQPHQGYIQGISTNVAANNHQLLNQKLDQYGMASAYPKLNQKFFNDTQGYIANLNAGHKGTGEDYASGTSTYPIKPREDYVPYRLKKHEADFINAVINDQHALGKGPQAKKAQELASKAGTLLTPAGETNQLRHALDTQHEKETGEGGDTRWSKTALEPTIRTFRAGLVHELHESEAHMPESIRQGQEFKPFTESLQRQVVEGRPDIEMAANLMPRPNQFQRNRLINMIERLFSEGKHDEPTARQKLAQIGETPEAYRFIPEHGMISPHEQQPEALTPEEHAELTGNLRRQWIEGKLKTRDYKERLAEIPLPEQPSSRTLEYQAPEEGTAGAYLMPMAGQKAAGYQKAKAEGRTFETPLPGGGERFEISDEDLEMRPPPKGSKYGTNLEHQYYFNPRGSGEIKLADAIKHPDLFQNYPFLRNTRISMDPTIRQRGYYEQPRVGDEGEMDGDHIVLKEPEDKSTLTHEIQHAVQYFEKFAGQGSSVEMALNRLTKDSSIREQLEKQWPGMTEQQKKIGYQPEIAKLHWVQHRLDDMAHALYQMDPGEIEARVAGRRSLGISSIKPAEDVRYEMGQAATEGRRAGTVSTIPPAPAGGRLASAMPFKRTTPEDFIAQRNKSTRSGYLSELKPEDIQGHHLFTNPEGTVGAAVSPEGDIQNVFNNGGGQGAGGHALLHALENGGRTLDAYDGFLPDYYRQFGFHETGRMKFNPAFAHNWDTKQGSPDVVFMGWGGHPEGGPEAALQRARDKTQTGWIPNEESTRYDDDWDAQKSRSQAFARGTETNRPAGMEQRPQADQGRDLPQSAAGAGYRGAVAPSAPGSGGRRLEYQPPEEGTAGAYLMPAAKGKKAAPLTSAVPEISPAISERLGERPADEDQAALYDRMAGRMAKEIPGAIPLRPKLNKKGEFTADQKGNPKYEEEDYDIANAPMLEQQGKSIGWTKTGGMAKAPTGTKDTLDKDDLYYLKYNKDGTPSDDRLRVSHLNEVSAVHSFADKLVDMFHGVKDDPEIMKAAGWYPEVEQMLKEHFGEHANLVAHLLAATSAGTGVRPNFTMTMNALERYLSGDFDRHIDLYRKAHQMQEAGTLRQHLMDAGIHDQLLPKGDKGDTEAMARYILYHDISPVQLHGKVNPKTGQFEHAKFGFNSAAVLRVLAHTWLEEAEGPKTPNYGGNLSGRTLQATIDMWAARTMRRLGYDGHTDKPWLLHAPSEAGVNNVDFGLSQLAFREAAKRLNMEPRVLQAVLWFAEQKHYQSQGWERPVDPAERDYRPMLRSLMEHGPLTTHLPGKEPRAPVFKKSGKLGAPALSYT